MPSANKIIDPEGLMAFSVELLIVEKEQFSGIRNTFSIKWNLWLGI